MNDFFARLSVALLFPAAIVAWRHSKIVALALALPLTASLVIAARGIELAVDHPARILIPVASLTLGFAEVYAEGKHNGNVSRALLLGALVVASGMADLAQLPAFAVLNGWAVPALQIFGCLGIIVISTLPKRRIPWLISLFS